MNWQFFFRERTDCTEKAEEVHCQKAYPREEIEELIREAGMELLAVYDAYTGKAASEESERIILHRKRKRQSKIRNEVNS